MARRDGDSAVGTRKGASRGRGCRPSTRPRCHQQAPHHGSAPLKEFVRHRLTKTKRQVVRYRAIEPPGPKKPLYGELLVSQRDFRIKPAHNLLTSPPRSNPANRPGPQTMPECRFNKYNATSKKIYGEEEEERV